jgi:hypothetical protein
MHNSHHLKKLFGCCAEDVLHAFVTHTGTLAWHTEAEHPGWTATYELLRPYLNQGMRAATLPPVARILQRQLRLHR